MNCQVVQNKMLALPDPRVVPDALRAHLAGCETCRVWARQAARLEALVEQLPAPPAPAGRKATFIANLGRPLARPARPRERSFFQRNAVVIGGLAAAVLVALGAWFIFPRNTGTPEVAQTPDDPFLKKLVQRDLALANADTPARRLKVLGGLADDLSSQARSLARVASPDELRDLAHWYSKVVTDAIVKQAERMPVHALPPAERQAEFQALADRLGETAAETDRMLGSVPPESKPALQKIADTARAGQKSLLTTELRGKAN